MGPKIGHTDNMFRTYEFDVKEHLLPGENEIEILFDSALRVGQEKLAQHYIHSWSTDSHKLPGGNYVRKAACHFGWDWGPKLVTCGIWRDIELLAFDTRLGGVHISQDHGRPGQVTAAREGGGRDGGRAAAHGRSCGRRGWAERGRSGNGRGRGLYHD